MKIRGRVLAGFIFITMLTVWAPSSAGAAWSASDPVSEAGADPNDLVMDGTPDGRAFVVWRQTVSGDDLIKGVPVDAGGQAGQILTLSAAGQDAKQPAVAIDADGEATVAWSRSNGANDLVQSVSVSPAGVKGMVVNRSATGGNAVLPEVAYGDNGSVGITWRRYDGAHWITQSRLIFDNGSADSIREISDNTVDSRDRPQIEPLVGGTFRVAWIEGSTEASSNVRTRTLSATGTPGTTSPVSTTGGNSQYVDMDTNADGDAAIAWQRYNNVDNHWSAVVSRVPEGGSPSPYFAVAPLSRDAFDPEVGIAADDSLVASWTAYQSTPSTYFAEAATVSPQGPVSGPISLSGAFEVGGSPVALDVNPAGWATFVWYQYETLGAAPVLSRRLSPSGKLGEEVQVNDSHVISAIYPSVAVADDGVAISTFQGYDAQNSKFAWTSRFTDPGVAITPASSDFGTRPVNSFGPTMNISVTNSGSTPNPISGVALGGTSPSDFTLVSGGGCLKTLAAGQSCQVQVAFTPKTVGTKSATLRIDSSAPVATASLTGTANDPTTLILKVRPKAKKVKRGKKAKLKVTVLNGGGLTARSAKVCWSGKKQVIKPKKKCLSFGDITIGKSKVRKVKIGLGKKARKGKKYPVKFKLTSANAPVKKASVKLRAKK